MGQIKKLILAKKDFKKDIYQENQWHYVGKYNLTYFDGDIEIKGIRPKNLVKVQTLIFNTPIVCTGSLTLNGDDWIKTDKEIRVGILACDGCYVECDSLTACKVRAWKIKVKVVDAAYVKCSDLTVFDKLNVSNDLGVDLLSFPWSRPNISVKSWNVNWRLILPPETVSGKKEIKKAFEKQIKGETEKISLSKRIAKCLYRLSQKFDGC